MPIPDTEVLLMVTQSLVTSKWLFLKLGNYNMLHMELSLKTTLKLPLVQDVAVCQYWPLLSELG